jgi:hypothetical protein
MNTRKLVSALCVPRLWLACAAFGVLGLAGCSSDSGTKPDARPDVPIGGGGGSPGVDGKLGEVGPAPGTGGKGGSIDAAGGAPGIDGAAGAVRLDGAGTGGVAIDGGKGTGGRLGTGGVGIDGGGAGGAGGSKLDVAPVDVRYTDAPPKLDLVNRDLPITPDLATCGVLGTVCCANQTCTESGTSCQSGRCRACGGDTEPCCEGSVCAAGGCCVPSSVGGTECVVAGSSCSIRGGSAIGGVCGGGACASDAGACGALNDPCCRSNNTYRCTASNVVCTGATGGSAGKCAACGRSGQACCSGDTCTQAGAECNSDGICELCGAANQACCGGPGGECNTGLGCTPVDGGSACKPCGEATQPCCGTALDRYCATVMLVCVESGTGTRATTECEPCGASGQRCCAGQACNANMSCRGTGDAARCQ